METGIRYTEVTNIVLLSPWEAGHKHCIQLTFADGNSVLLQVSCSIFWINIVNVNIFGSVQRSMKLNCCSGHKL